MNLTKRITGVIALVAILLLLAGVPMLLWWLGQPFIPTAVPDLGQAIGALFRRDDGTMVLLLIYLVAWIAWLYLSIAVLVEGWAAIRRLPAPQLPGFRLPQGIAKRLVAAALLAFVATPAIANANPPATAAAVQPAVTPPKPPTLSNTPWDLRTRYGTWPSTTSGTPTAIPRSSTPTKGSSRPTEPA